MNATLTPIKALGHGGLGRLLMTAATFSMAAATAVTAATGAVFTDTDSVSGNTFSSGTVAINGSPASTAISLSAMAPGDTASGSITVANDGSLQLRYAITSVTTEDTLAGELELTVWDEAEEADAGTDCNATPPGTVLYNGILGSTGGTNIIGNPAQGAHAGDRVLAAAASEVLCLQVSLPLSTTNAAQGQSTEVNLNFEAEQTANN